MLLEILRKLTVYTGLYDDEKPHCVGCNQLGGHFEGCPMAQAIREAEKVCEWKYTLRSTIWQATSCGHEVCVLERGRETAL